MVCNNCEANRYIIMFLSVIILFGCLIFYKGLLDYANLKRDYFGVKRELKQCEKQLKEYGDQVGYQIGLIHSFRKENSLLTNEIVRLSDELEQFITNPMSWVAENYQSYNLEATAYSPTVDQCDDTPFIAASGKFVDDWTIAVSQNMRKDGWGFGKFVYIPDHNKFYKINDVMNKRFTKRVDIFMWDRQEATDFGFCDIDVYLLN